MAYVPEQIASTYTKIDKTQLMQVLGVAQATDVTALGLKMVGTGKFVTLEKMTEEVQFSLNEQRVK